MIILPEEEEEEDEFHLSLSQKIYENKMLINNFFFSSLLSFPN